jgi:hypothetical protein
MRAQGKSAGLEWIETIAAGLLCRAAREPLSSGSHHHSVGTGKNQRSQLPYAVTRSGATLGETGLAPATPGPPDQFSNRAREHFGQSFVPRPSLTLRRLEPKDGIEPLTLPVGSSCGSRVVSEDTPDPPSTQAIQRMLDGPNCQHDQRPSLACRTRVEQDLRIVGAGRRSSRGRSG